MKIGEKGEVPSIFEMISCTSWLRVAIPFTPSMIRLPSVLLMALSGEYGRPRVVLSFAECAIPLRKPVSLV